MVVVSAKNKPLAVLHLISDTKKALCFTSSVESATRLSVLIQLFANRCGKYLKIFPQRRFEDLINR